MDVKDYDIGDIDMAWCPGCGNFSIIKIIKRSLAELEITPSDVVFVSGIGQAAKLPHYLKCNFFNGLHGRSVPVATAIKATNPRLTVIADSGDGCNYGEGGNHFIHGIRRNPDLLHLVHDNMIYGLTKGQASPTSMKGMVTPVQVDGVILEPFNPLTTAIALNASFVARAYCGDQDKAVDIVKEAIQHEGYALVDMLQPCPSFNEINTYKWYKENTYYLEDDHDRTDRSKAFEVATDLDRLALGVLYTREKPTFEGQQQVYSKEQTPLWKRGQHDPDTLRELIKKHRD
ncbi:2-oxoacid ferredoxin oxidoreductase [Candidatus Bathyarchaeota archaeon]|nr:2-oxoacid ferredoxin oxidoreductase [Candidatus Bathyarchaeota archaeon]